MKSLHLFKIILLIFASFICYNVVTHKKANANILEVYTQKNIYFVDTYNLTVSNEANEKILKFKNFEELNEYISTTTANEQ